MVVKTITTLRLMTHYVGRVLGNIAVKAKKVSEEWSLTKHSKCVNLIVFSLAVNTRKEVKFSVSCQNVTHLKGADMKVHFSQYYL